MDGIFISYRREDSAGYAGRLYDRLAAHFGAERVFMDVEGIAPGTDFVDAIEQAVASCKVLIVLIGNDWMDIADGSGQRRLDDPNDFIRVETSTALKRDIRVVPVLLEGAEMPRSDELPDELVALSRRQAIEISHKQWEASTGNLIETLDKIFYPVSETDTGAVTPVPGSRVAIQSFFGRKGPWIAAGLVGAAAAGLWLVVRTLPQVAAPPATPVAPVLTEPVTPPIPTPPPGRLEAQPLRIEFGTITVGAYSVASVNLRNTGGADVLAPQPVLEGDKASDITIESHCPEKIPPKENCTIELRFAPREAGALNTRFSIGRGDDSSIAVTLSGVAEDRPAPPITAPATPVAMPTAAPATAASPAPEPAPTTAAATKPGAAPKAVTPGAPVAEPAPKAVTPSTPVAEPAPKAVTPSTSVAERSPSPVTPAKPKTAPPPVVRAPIPRILRFTSAVTGTSAKLCYEVEDTEQVTITPQPGRIKNLPSDCVSVRIEGRTTFKIVARSKNRSVTDSLVAVPDRSASRHPTPSTTPLRPAPAVAVDDKLPAVNDQWVYRVSGRWPTIPVRALEVSAVSVDPKAVKESLALIDHDSRKPLGQRPVRGPVAYVTRSNHLGTEFSPYLAAFGGLDPDATWQDIPTPDTSSFWTGWYTTGEVEGNDTVSVPAGNFRAVKVEISSSRTGSGNRTEENVEPVRVRYDIWYAPEVKRYVKMVRTTISAAGQTMDKDTFELTSYRQK